MSKSLAILLCAFAVATQGVLVEVGDGLLSLNIIVHDGNVTVVAVAKTTGYIGFGISDGGGTMVGSDIFIVGVNETGPYIGDYFGTGYAPNGVLAAPMLDPEAFGGHQDVYLILAEEEGNSTTTAIFTRTIAAPDDLPFDQPFVNGENRIIWSVGMTDDLNHHGKTRRGTFLVTLNF